MPIKRRKGPGVRNEYVLHHILPLKPHRHDEVPRRYRPPRHWRRRLCPHRPRLENLGPFHGPRWWQARLLPRGGPRQDLQGVCGLYGIGCLGAYDCMMCLRSRHDHWVALKMASVLLFQLIFTYSWYHPHDFSRIFVSLLYLLNRSSWTSTPTETRPRPSRRRKRRPRRRRGRRVINVQANQEA